MLTPINGWTRDTMLEAIEKYVPDTPRGCSLTSGRCMYLHEEARCAVGAFMPEDVLESVLEWEDNHEVVLTADDLGDIGIPKDWQPLDFGNLARLQRIHDTWSDREDGETARDACKTWVRENVEA